MPATESRTIDSFGDLRYGDKIEYVGPRKLPGDYAAPNPYQQPYEFCHTFMNGGFRASTKHGYPKIISRDHPINDPSKWRRV